MAPPPGAIGRLNRATAPGQHHYVYNMAKYLPQTIESVLARDYPNIEYIVMAGGSIDGSIEILESYRRRQRFRTSPRRDFRLVERKPAQNTRE
jgi:cellulose synthase/poly-beta-1,6-N-acetylglucosamine synthase-like glycosyltransferase